VTEVSARLRAARERAGLSIRDIAASTRIRPASLEAIERGDFAALPGEFYTRAFLRTYAAQLGLSPQAIVAEYDADRPQAPPAATKPDWSASVRSLSSQFVAAATSSGVVIALVVVLLGLAVTRSRPDAVAPAEPRAVGTAGSAPSTPAAAPAIGSSAPASIPTTQPLTIDIQAGATLWVTGAADGKRVLYRLLSPGERVSIKANDSLAFRVGDASAFTYAINGAAGKPLGGAGEVRDVEITRANYRSFTR
jgi:cytoskeletal protein RodZ